jgi:nitroimidazol reductase NimA-like FMN-containing flavoprotein (pyridoxamine 5'-phosphate oxidase superfamily)
VPGPKSALVVTDLSSSACREKLEKAIIGRIAVSVDALPVVLPVNFAVVGDSIVIRTTVGTKLSAAAHHAVVAFEVDDYDEKSEVGWSVLVQGTAREITLPDRVEQMRQLPLRPVSEEGSEDKFIEVEMQIVTGRHVEPPHAETPPPLET